MGRRIYVAGPMTRVGPPTYNWPDFEEKGRELRMRDWEAILPTERDEAWGYVLVTRDTMGGIVAVETTHLFDYDEVLAMDLDALSTCDAAFFLEGWEQSPGAVREWWAARSQGLDLYYDLDDVPVAGADEEGCRSAPLIGLVGFAQSGKDTVASYLAPWGFERLAFADKLKDVALLSDPVIGAAHLSSIVIDHGWEYAKAKVPGVREYLQNLGVAVRAVLGSDTWVRAAFEDHDPTVATVITDVRFPDEVEAVRARGGIIVQVARPGTRPPNDHISEALAKTIEDIDYVIPNSGTLDDLKLEVVDLVTQVVF